MAAKTKKGQKVTRSSSARKTTTQATVQAATANAQSEPASQPEVRKRITLITNGPWTPEADHPQSMMGRAIRPFAKPAQSGAFAPFAVAQARRGH
jgi:hypothetical protein